MIRTSIPAAGAAKHRGCGDGERGHGSELSLAEPPADPGRGGEMRERHERDQQQDVQRPRPAGDGDAFETLRHSRFPRLDPARAVMRGKVAANDR